jgi:hypothetical protein
MRFVLLLALLACNQTKSPEATPAAAEADATQSSPYTVEECYCMKIFAPVCADGQEYGNSCEAECNGHRTWTEGSCK